MRNRLAGALHFSLPFFIYYYRRGGRRLRDMRSTHTFLLIILIGVGSPAFSHDKIWVTAYYAGWMQGQTNNGHLPAQNIDYSALTHIIHFAVLPTETGHLETRSNGLSSKNSAELIRRAHRAGVKVLLAVGGSNSAPLFRDALRPRSRKIFLTNIMDLVRTRGYDGIDIDWEVLEDSDEEQFVEFMRDLRAELDKMKPRGLLTAAAGHHPGVFAKVHPMLDQLNVMTYDMAGAWSGWTTWHNSPLYDGGFTFPGTSRHAPSADQILNEFASAGIPREKLGLGIDFYGYVWSGGKGMSSGGAAAPRQSWEVAPGVQSNVPYYSIMEKYYKPEWYRWDEDAEAAYLMIDNDGSRNDVFVSYDDEYTCRKKVEYVRENGLGGVFIWELGGGFLSPKFKNRDRLLKAVKDAVEQLAKSGD